MNLKSCMLNCCEKTGSLKLKFESCTVWGSLHLYRSWQHVSSQQQLAVVCQNMLWKMPTQTWKKLTIQHVTFPASRMILFQFKKLCSGMCRQLSIFIKYILVYIHGYIGQLKWETKVVFFTLQVYFSSVFSYCVLFKHGLPTIKVKPALRASW